ncbi:MAG: penicillin-binding protein 2 [Deltaproteobacteria bacterium]|nr:penicillin-binding protein 2 [Deltaproteobacteria bacterium]
MIGSSFDPEMGEIYTRRLRTVTLVVIIVFVVLILRLWYLQVVKGPSYRIQSENNRIHLQDIPPFRGMIFDRNGDLLVDNRPSFDMNFIPEEIQDRNRLFDSLHKLIGLDDAQARAKLDKKGRGYPFKPLLVEKNISRDDLAIIETNLFNLPGVKIQVRPQRNYAYGEFGCHIIGYLGEISERQLRTDKYPGNRSGDLIGKYGVEKKWQKALHGYRGGEQVEVDAAGRRLKVISRKPPIPGLNLTLTIDKKLQMAAEKGLKGKTGAVVVLNPNNGEILAMASSPAFDPNLFIEGIDRKAWKRIISSKDYPLQNRAIASQYPPGSVFKIAVALAGLEEGAIDPEEEVFCNGSYTLGTHTFRCWKKYGHGKVKFHKALVQSCDVYFYKLARRLGVDAIAKYAMMCGLGKKTGYDLGYETAGLIPTRKWKLKRWGVPWQAGETISTAIGQSFVQTTPLQLANLVACVFNGGNLYQPKVVKHVGKGDRAVYRFSPSLNGRVTAKKENLERIKRALIGVVNEPRGTGSKSRVKGITVAGKTGTAQVINLDREKELDRGSGVPLKFRDHAWFVAVAPAEKPEIAMAIFIEHGGHGGSAAAPLAKVLIETYLKGKG